MKHLPLILLLCLGLQLHAQCTYETNVPDELYRGRYQPVGAWYKF